MVAWLRLLALIVAMHCVTATVQTGEWHGPADLACVGEGHSMPPDRRFDALFDQLVDTDDALAWLPRQFEASRQATVYVPLGASLAANWPVAPSSRAGGPRGPPTA